MVIDSKDWNSKLGLPVQAQNHKLKLGVKDNLDFANRDEKLKDIKSKLSKLSNFISDTYNKSISQGTEFNRKWLELQIDLFNNKKSIIELDILTNYINKYIEESPFKTNQKKEIGLGDGRIQNLKLFFNTIKRYEIEVLSARSIIIKEINLQFVEKFKI